MSASDSVITITKAHILRHAPTKSAAGWPAAVMDVGQDLLLRHLAECGVLDLVAFKGGTSIRKVYAGAGGRFSTDLDFSIANLNDNPATVLDMVTDSIKGTEIGPFRFDIERRRERPEIVYHYQGDTSGTGALRSKLDVGPPPWLAPELKRWVPAAIHRQYGGALPPLPVVDLAENGGREDRPAQPCLVRSRRLRSGLVVVNPRATRARSDAGSPTRRAEVLGRSERVDRPVGCHLVGAAPERQTLRPRSLDSEAGSEGLRRREHRSAHHPAAQPRGTRRPTC